MCTYAPIHARMHVCATHARNMHWVKAQRNHERVYTQARYAQCLCARIRHTHAYGHVYNTHKHVMRNVDVGTYAKHACMDTYITRTRTRTLHFVIVHAYRHTRTLHVLEMCVSLPMHVRIHTCVMLIFTHAPIHTDIHAYVRTRARHTH